MMKLLGSPRGFPELPPLWDGHPVKWGSWEKHITTSLQFSIAGAGDCDSCGLSSSLWDATGWWADLKLGGEWERRGMRNFHATRCGWCGNTTVYTFHDDQSWKLDETDYGASGSYDVEEQQRLF